MSNTEPLEHAASHVREAAPPDKLLPPSEQLFWATFNSSPAAQVITDFATGRILEANAAYCRLVGYPRAALIGRTTVEMQIWQDPDARTATIAALQHSGFLHDREFKIRTSAGAIRTQLASFELLELDGRKCIVSSTIDITDRKQAEDRLRASEHTLSLFVEHAPAAIAMFDRSMRYIAVSRRFMIDYQIVGQNIIGRSHYDVFPEIPARWQEIHSRCLAGATEKAEEDPFPRADGTLDWVQWEICPWYDESGAIGGIILFSEVITARVRARTERRESEERFRTAFDHMLEGAQIISFDRRYLYLNAVALAHSRRPREELLGNLYTAVWPGSEDTHLFAMLQRCMVDRIPCRMQNEFVYADGVVRWFELSIQPIPEGIFVLSIDVTERKQAEIELRRSEEQYRGLVKTLDSAIATVDYAGRILYMNDVAAAPFGRAAGDLIGNTMLDLFPGPGGIRPLDSIRRVIREDEGRVVESLTAVGGVPRWYRTSIQPIHDEHGRVVYALVNSTDIHELKQAQQELIELNRTLEARIAERTAEVQDLYDHAPAGYHSLDAEGRFVRINQTELGWLGYTRDEVLGRRFVDFITPASQSLFRTSFPAFVVTGAVRDLEFDMVRKDGSTLSVLLNATAISDAEGRYLLSRSTVFDNSARKQADDALRIANLEMARAVRLKDEFLANMSHELRTPLTGMLALGENLQELIYGPLNERQLKILTHIETSSRHLLALINDLLDLSKIEAGELDLELQPVLVAEITEASLLFVKEMAHKKSIQLSCQTDQPHTIVVADARRLKQMLVNLLGNAVKFTPAGGRVQLAVTADAGAQQIRFVVQDTGIGIPPDAQARLFQPFTQLDSALARQYPGTGLGLALVKRLAAQHGGSVSVASSGIPGEGSCFTVVLPYNTDTDCPLAP